MRKRILSALLALSLALTLLPGAALAAEVTASGECGARGNNLTWTLDADGLLTICGIGAMEGDEDETGNYALVLDAGVRSAGGGDTYEAELLFADGSTKLVTTDKRYGGTNLSPADTGSDTICIIGQWVTYREDSRGRYVLTKPSVNTTDGKTSTNMMDGSHKATAIGSGEASFTIGDISGVTSNASRVVLGSNQVRLNSSSVIIVKTKSDTFKVYGGVKNLPKIELGKILYSAMTRANQTYAKFLYIDASDGTTEVSDGTNNDLFLVANEGAKLSSDGTNEYYTFKGVVDGTITNRIRLNWNDPDTQGVITQLLNGKGSEKLFCTFSLEDGLYEVDPAYESGVGAKASDKGYVATTNVEKVTATVIEVDSDTYDLAEGCKFFRADANDVNARIVETTWRGIITGDIGLGTGDRYAYVALSLNRDYEVAAVYCRMAKSTASAETASVNSLSEPVEQQSRLTVRSAMGPAIHAGARAVGPWSDHEDEILSLVVEDGVTTISAYAFQSCYNLKTAVIADSVWKIGTGAFEFCEGLESIRLPASLTSIAPHTLCGCSSLQSVEIPDGVTDIGEWAFWNCGSLTDITIPASVTSIGDRAFYGCESLEGVNYLGTLEQWLSINIGEDNVPLLAAPVICSDGFMLPGGVKFVPYSHTISSDGSLVKGTLPSGLTVNDGVISGVPMADGVWSFVVEGTEGRKNLGLRILDNTNAAVQKPNDYVIEEYVGNQDPQNPNYFLKDSYTEETLIINGPYDEFTRLLIDGRPQERGEDYTAWEGSTVITIRAQTFRQMGEGTHTIAAEFRTGGTRGGEMKKAAQNYTLRLSSSSFGGGFGGLGGGSKKNSGKTQGTQQTGALPFADVSPSDWFYQDLVWAYENGLMFGVTEKAFMPQEKVTQAAVVTVLARLARVDLTQFEGVEEPGILTGRSFTPAAVWAKRSGLLPEEGMFTGGETTNRNEMAVMLVKYLTSMGKDTTPPSQRVEFADAEDMTQEGNDAFQFLYQQSIFKGVGGLKMNAAGSTTRAHFVALVHRIYETAMNQA